MSGVIILIILAIFLAMNMGISGFSVSFAPSYGSNILSKNRAAILYAICVILGAYFLGARVVNTLSKKIFSCDISLYSSIVIFSSCAITMFLSNILKVPQSTSFVTVASFVGAGIFYGKVNWYTVIKILLFALIFSILSFTITILLKRKIYPPHQRNLRFYEKFFAHRDKFKKFIIFHDLYAAFSIGTNNVANVVAPLIFLIGESNIFLFLFFGVFFALGAYLKGEKLIKSVSKEIIPVGEFSASIVSFTTATFVIIASFFGLPTPYVQFTTFSLLGISCVKDGFRYTFSKTIVKRILCVWILVPLFTTFLSYILHRIIL
ncbi:MAG: inorganic phosphate transporter [Candidatus Omnitrophota bacterium]